MTRIDFKEALVYPFLEPNRLNTLLFPGLIYFVQNAIAGVIGLTMAGIAMVAEDSNLEKLADVIAQIMNLPFSLVAMALLLGYTWKFYTNFQREGPQCKAPEWMGQWKSYLLSGFKLYGFYVVLMAGVYFVLLAPLLLSLILFFSSNLRETDFSTVFFIMVVGYLALIVFAFIFLIPFFWAPLVHTAQKPSFRALFNLKKAIQITRPRYGQLMLTLLYMILVGFIYGLGTMVLFCTCVGILALPFIQGAATITTAHLICQGFDYQPENLESSGS
jgi:hypothetical protein